jgi:hypothetical protein
VGDDVVGVFDWEVAHRGSRQEDSEFLTQSLASYLERDAAFTERIRTAVERGFHGNGNPQPMGRVAPTERS